MRNTRFRDSIVRASSQVSFEVSQEKNLYLLWKSKRPYFLSLEEEETLCATEQTMGEELFLSACALEAGFKMLSD